MNQFSLDAFQQLIASVTDTIAGLPLNQQLEDQLNRSFPAGSDLFKAIEKACHDGIAAGVLCRHEGGGIKYGRVIKPTQALQGCSVDVVDMDDLAGPHHRHPRGEIDMIMPIDLDARFDGRGAGWLVYGPDSTHAPTVTGGRALILYLLPGGEIEFTKH